MSRSAVQADLIHPSPFPGGEAGEWAPEVARVAPLEGSSHGSLEHMAHVLGHT